MLVSHQIRLKVISSKRLKPCDLSTEICIPASLEPVRKQVGVLHHDAQTKGMFC